MTEGEKLIWAAAYSTAVNDRLGAKSAVELASHTVIELRNSAGLIYKRLEKSENPTAISMLRIMLDDPEPTTYNCRKCGLLVIEPLGDGCVSNLCKGCLQAEWDKHGV